MVFIGQYRFVRTVSLTRCIQATDRVIGEQVLPGNEAVVGTGLVQDIDHLVQDRTSDCYCRRSNARMRRRIFSQIFLKRRIVSTSTLPVR